MIENRVYSGIEKTNSGDQSEITNVVRKTSNYDLFKLSKFNRNVLIRQEMLDQAERGFIAPIIVNENMVVIDGQHRLEASKRIGVPVSYIVINGLDKDDIVNMNTVQRKWGMANFIEAFANQGNPEYIKLVDILKGVYNNTTVVCQVAFNVQDILPVRKAVESGNFKFYNYEKTLEFFNFLIRFKEQVKVPMKTKLSLALFELFKIEKVDRERLINKVIETKLDEELRAKTFNMTEALKELIDAYNKNLTKKTGFMINYYITSNGLLKIDEEKHDWAKKSD